MRYLAHIYLTVYICEGDAALNRCARSGSVGVLVEQQEVTVVEVARMEYN
jgi:hypothetical protein